MQEQQRAALVAISPIDGRYYNKTKVLSPYFSEFALIRYRLIVEVKYLQFLKKLELPQFDAVQQSDLEKLLIFVEALSADQALEIKEIEKETNHDVKSVEYFLKAQMEQFNLGSITEFVHFGLTSQDINNTAVPLSIKEALEAEIYPAIESLLNRLEDLSKQYEAVPMLARTHGQAASPTLLGKEIAVFWQRLKAQFEQLKNIPIHAKFGGATGNFNAHYLAYPEIDWHKEAKVFVEDAFGLYRSFPTTQIEHYDMLAAQNDCMSRIQTILIDLARDMWTYISMDYFKQKTIANEVGSSAMPHKVNPIDFENAEGNLGISIAIFDHLSRKLPISRLQRDLTDSTVLRNIGVPYAHFLIAQLSLMKGLSKLELNEARVADDLAGNEAVLAEAIQTILRREGFEKPYELLKKYTRGKQIDRKTLSDLINDLALDSKVKEELEHLRPKDYTGPVS